MLPADDILRAEALLGLSMKTGDVAALDAMLSDSVLWVDIDGEAYIKADVLNLASNEGRLRIQILDSQPALHATNGIVSITHVPSNLTACIDGKRIEGLFVYTRVWANTDGQWRVQTSTCAPGGLVDQGKL
jgi:hypothetical protein